MRELHYVDYTIGNDLIDTLQATYWIYDLVYLENVLIPSTLKDLGYSCASVTCRCYPDLLTDQLVVADCGLPYTDKIKLYDTISEYWSTRYN